MNVSAPDRRSSDRLASKVKIIETDPQTDSRWAAFVSSHPEGSVYHHPGWLEALSGEHGQKSLHLACESEDGRFLAVMPLMYTKGLPFNLGGSMVGRRLSSLPRTPLAGPLSSDSRATVAIVRDALDRVRKGPDMQLQIKTQGSELDGLVEGIYCSPWRNSYLLTLPLSSEGTFRISDSQMRTRVKWAVNKAAKLGVVVRPAETMSELREWYGLYLDTMRRSTVPPRPYRFFCALWDILRPQGTMQLLIAERQRKILAGSVFFKFGSTVSYAFNGSCRKDLSLRPNDAIQWHAINEACGNGYRKFDFGEVPEDHHELAHFKSKWGAKPIRLYRFSSSTPGGVKAGADYRRGRAISWAATVWRRLPIKATEWLGDLVYSYL
jgi:CelD/BcsL family acetyltransferase involved in cellulose biosynthesis